MKHHITYIPRHWIDFIRLNDQELQRKCRMDIYKATGKGGQKKNKTSNAVRLTLEHLSVTASASRSRQDNISRAVKKMRLAIAMDLSDSSENRSGLSELPGELKNYVSKGLIRINEKNPAFPYFSGVLFDIYLDCEGDVKIVAERLGTSSSQIHRFFSSHPFLLERMNALKQKFRR